jgi:hypothetical protein
MKNLVGSTFICIALLFVSSYALADVPPPETEPCLGKAAGAACTYGGAGTCQQQTCGKPSSEYPCLMCLTGTDTKTDTNTSGDSGCSVGRASKDSAMGKLGPWLMGGVFGLFFLLIRRRKQQ